MSLNLIGGASGICHFLAISGLAPAWGGEEGREARAPGSEGLPHEAGGGGCRGAGPGRQEGSV